jgi:hypothetical protein
LSAGGTQLPAESQTVGATQSLTEVQLFRHLPLLSHLYGAQSFVVPSAAFAVWSASHVAPGGPQVAPPSPRLRLPIAVSHVPSPAPEYFSAAAHA